MRCVFYHVAPYKRDIQDAIYLYSLANRIEIEYIEIEGEMGIESILNQKCAIFYFLADSDRVSQMQIPQAKKVVLCHSYEEGIRALEEGSDYALQIPINKDKLMRCCKYLCQGHNSQEVKP